jgi:hypothetical protein
MTWFLAAPGSLAAIEQSFDVLEVGTQTYRNVTVTTKSKNYVFIIHSDGMTNLKISELPVEVLTRLGYEDPKAPKVSTNAATVWAKKTLAKLDTPEVKAVPDQVQTTWNKSSLGAKLPIPKLTKEIMLAAAGIALLLYLCHSYCLMLICRKAGTEPGFLIWVPILQLLPLLTAAGMSRWWFLGYCVPGLSLVAHIIWCFKICDARGKTAFVAVLLILPVTSPLAFLFLAFSNGVKSAGQPEQSRPKSKRIELMTLETA